MCSWVGIFIQAVRSRMHFAAVRSLLSFRGISPSHSTFSVVLFLDTYFSFIIINCSAYLAIMYFFHVFIDRSCEISCEKFRAS